MSVKYPNISNQSWLLQTIVKSFLVHDFSITKSFPLSEGELEIGLGIMNAFDKSAPLLYDAPDFSFDTRVHDPRGRLINITAEFNF